MTESTQDAATTPAEPWTPDRPEDATSAIFQALGAASACWEHLDRAGVFDSTRAKWVGDGLIDWLTEHGTEVSR